MHEMIDMFFFNPTVICLSYTKVRFEVITATVLIFIIFTVLFFYKKLTYHNLPTGNIKDRFYTVKNQMRTCTQWRNCVIAKVVMTSFVTNGILVGK